MEAVFDYQKDVVVVVSPFHLALLNFFCFINQEVKVEFTLISCFPNKKISWFRNFL